MKLTRVLLFSVCLLKIVDSTIFTVGGPLNLTGPGIATLVICGILKIFTTAAYFETFKGQVPPITKNKRSLEEHRKISENLDLLLESVAHLDADGCVPKLLCHLQTMGLDSLVPAEMAIVNLFSAESEDVLNSITNVTAPLFYASGIGRYSLDNDKCNDVYARCSLSAHELRGILRQAWGCPS